MQVSHKTIESLANQQFDHLLLLHIVVFFQECDHETKLVLIQQILAKVSAVTILEAMVEL